MNEYRLIENENDECKPLINLAEVLSWESKLDWSVIVKPLKSRSSYCYDGNSFKCHKMSKRPIRLFNSSAPKTLLCHDMKGGYLDDKFVNGCIYKHQYLFYHWSTVDIFVYFSHYFVTIPPLMWINAAHNNGVEILGTIITEFEEGEKIWIQILNSENILCTFVEKLVKICKHYKFDGYLINIENRINAQYLTQLYTFLKKLKNELQTYGIIIWYDAVSFLNGKLEWQNELNEHNQLAFQICDGIFLNYTWQNFNLENSVVHAGCRRHDVYVGIDIFGRGCFGGGGFNTNKAVAVARSFGLSVALFGFGWTHEIQASEADFFIIERKFWTRLWPYLYVHVPNFTPFDANFNRGVSYVLKNDELRYDLSWQCFQLPVPSCLNENLDKYCISHFTDDSYLERNCILLNQEMQETEIHRLLLCDFSCSEKIPLHFTLVTKALKIPLSFKIFLIVEDQYKNFMVVLKISNKIELLNDDLDYSCSLNLTKQINQTKVIEFYDNGWISNSFILQFIGQITEINAKLEESVLIGHLSVK